MAHTFTAPLRGVLARIPRPSALQDAAFAPIDDPDATAAPVVVMGAHNPEDAEGAVPDGIRVAAAWGWRLLVLGAVVVYGFRMLSDIDEVAIPFVVALLLTAAFWPMRDWLVRHKVRAGFAALLCMLTLALVVLGILALVSLQITSQWNALSSEAVNSFNQLTHWLETGPLHLSNSQLDSWLTQATDYVSNSRTKIAGYATTVGSQLSHFFAGLLLTLFALFYFLLEGRKLSSSVAVLLPRRSRDRIMDASTRGWFALVAYVRAAVIVAACDGIGALIGAFFLGSAMWLAIGALTFLCAFIPLIGAIFSGAIATGVVFVTLGPVKAIIMLAVFIAVLELEGHVMQPFLLGRAVSIHPLVVLFGIAIGMIVGGPVGALFTVPLMAFVNAFVRGYTARRRVPAGQEDTHGAERVLAEAEQAERESDDAAASKDAGLKDVARNSAEASEVEQEKEEREHDAKRSDDAGAKVGTGAVADAADGSTGAHSAQH